MYLYVHVQIFFPCGAIILRYFLLTFGTVILFKNCFLQLEKSPTKPFTVWKKKKAFGGVCKKQCGWGLGFFSVPIDGSIWGMGLKLWKEALLETWTLRVAGINLK